MIVFFGTYTQNSSFLKGPLNSGIPYYSFNEKNGLLSKQGTLAHPGNPSFLAFDPKRQILHSVAELNHFQGEDSGGYLNYKYDSEKEAWQEIDRESSNGQAPCHVEVDPTSNHVFISNYDSGNVTMLSNVDSEIRITSRSQQHTGHSINKIRQITPHAHSSLALPSNNLLLVADLGIDQILAYAIDRKRNRLVPHDIPSIPITSGSGPRHMAYHEPLGILYVLNELSADIAAIRFSPPYLNYEVVEFTSLRIDAETEPASAAEIAIHPNKRFLYASERQSGSIQLFSIQHDSGSLKYEHSFPVAQTPRHFSIHKSGMWLISCDQDKGLIQVWAIDPQSGALAKHGQAIEEAAVVCACFAD